MPRSRLLVSAGLALAVLAAPGAEAAASVAAPGAAPGAPAPGAPARPSPPVPTLEQRLRTTAGPTLRVARDARGSVRTLSTRAARGLDPTLGGGPGDAPARADAFARRYAALFGVTDPAALRVAASVAAPGGGRVVTLRQTVDGVPVLGGEVAVAVDSTGAVRAATGETGRDVRLTAGRVTGTAASALALAAASRAHEVPTRELTASSPAQWVFDPALVGGFPASAGGPRRVWRVDVTKPATSGSVAVRDLVLVDAVTGAITWRVDQIDHASAPTPNRVVCDGLGVRRSSYLCDNRTLPYKRVEGAAPSVSAEVNAAYDNAGRTAAFYATYLGIDLTQMIGSPMDDGVKKLRSTVSYCPEYGQGSCPYDNAFWDGQQMVYGQGYPVADDIVAHEMTHGVTDATAGLFYWYQSGAIDESMSDVFGELVDLSDGAGNDGPAVAWEIGEDAPTGAVRDMRDPSSTARLGVDRYAQPDSMTSPNYVRDVADNGGVHTNSGVGNKAAYLVTAGGWFHGYDVRGLGIAKAAAIYYQTLLMLPSGADYADLGATLPASCDALVAQSVDGMTAGDCDQVRAAVAATEMERQPLTNPVATQDATAPEAPVCATGTYASPLATDSLEHGTATWTIDHDTWDVYTGYASDGTNSLVGTPPSAPVPDVPGQPNPSAAVWEPGQVIPYGTPSYLRFAHSYDLETDGTTNYDGGVVEYSTDAGQTWRDAGALPHDNGYDGTTFDGHAAFVGDSRGYVSTRYDVTSLAGSRPLFRFRLLTDNGTNGEWLGWILDDVRLYSCVTTPVAPSAPTAVAAVGDSDSITVTWQPPAAPGTGTLTSYTVTAQPGGEQVTTPAASRKVTLTGLAEGQYTITVTAVNDSTSTASPASDPVTVTVAPAPTVSASATGLPGAVRVVATLSGVTAGTTAEVLNAATGEPIVLFNRSSWTLAEGATNAVFTVRPVSPGFAPRLRVRVTPPGGMSVTSEEVSAAALASGGVVASAVGVSRGVRLTATVSGLPAGAVIRIYVGSRQISLYGRTTWTTSGPGSYVFTVQPVTTGYAPPLRVTVTSGGQTYTSNTVTVAAR